MSGDIESEQLFFPSQTLLFRSWDGSCEIDLGFRKGHGAKQAVGVRFGQG
jgi:hypothetical protein